MLYFAYYRIGHVRLQRPLPSVLPSPPCDKSTSVPCNRRPTNYGLCGQRWHTPFAGACFLYLIRISPGHTAITGRLRLCFKISLLVLSYATANKLLHLKEIWVKK